MRAGRKAIFRRGTSKAAILVARKKRPCRYPSVAVIGAAHASAAWIIEGSSVRLCIGVGRADREDGKHQVNDRPDRDSVEDRANSDRAAEDPARGEHR